MRYLVGGGGALPTAQRPVGSGVAADPSSILTSYEVAGLYTRFTLEAPSTVSRSPEQGVQFGAASIDVFGAAAAFELADPLFRLRLWAEAATPPTDVILWAAMTQGALSGTSYGIAVGLEYTASGWRVQHNRNDGASWAAWDEASAVSGDTRGAYLQAHIRADDGQGYVNSVGIDAAGEVVGLSNSPTAPDIHNGWTGTELDTLTWGAGWATGVGGSAGAIASMSPALALLKRSSIQGLGL